MMVCELMVGDLVLHDGKVIRVDAVHKRKIGYHKTKDKLTWLFCGQFQPIPLTPEILEKNGFNLYNDMYTNDFMVLHDDKKFIKTKNVWSVGVYVDKCHRMATCELTYLHELQHILRLCKIDKEIVL